MVPWGGTGHCCRFPRGSRLYREQGISRDTRRGSSQPLSLDQSVAALDDHQYLEYYTSLVEQLKDQHNSHPAFDLMRGASFGRQEHWSVGRHYLMLTSASGKDILAWAWFDEELDWWLLQHIWVSPSLRRAGLATRMLQYIESATQYSSSDSRASRELRLTSVAGAEGFYERAGFTLLSGSVYAKSMSASRPEFQEAHHASRFCNRAMGMPKLDFRLHFLRCQ